MVIQNITVFTDDGEVYHVERLVGLNVNNQNVQLWLQSVLDPNNEWVIVNNKAEVQVLLNKSSVKRIVVNKDTSLTH